MAHELRSSGWLDRYSATAAGCVIAAAGIVVGALGV
jgi:hypothetical protein